MFFLDPVTRMNPHLNFAQAVPGVSPGRGIGIIDTLHLIEVPVAIGAMENSKAFPTEVVSGMRKWFAAYLDWMITSKNGKEEASAKNNHAVAFWTQAAVIARFAADETCLAESRRQFKEVFVRCRWPQTAASRPNSAAPSRMAIRFSNSITWPRSAKC